MDRFQSDADRPADSRETTIVVLVLVASAAVLLAPIAGRYGAAALANVLMITAASCGLATFAMAGIATVRAARRAGPHRDPNDPESGGPRSTDRLPRAAQRSRRLESAAEPHTQPHPETGR